MARHQGYVNIYRSGYFHSCGKPGAFDRHPGDIYPTREAAEGDITPRSHYIATVPVEWEEEEHVTANPVLGPMTPGGLYGPDDHYGEIQVRQ